MKEIFAPTENGNTVMTMAEYIEREKLLRDINHYHLSDGSSSIGLRCNKPPTLPRCVMGGGLTHTQTLSQIQCVCMESVRNADLNKEFLNI